MSKPICYTCSHRRDVPGSAHSRCNNPEANVTGDPIGYKNGWFIHPLNFDPVWLRSCDGHSTDPEDAKKPTIKMDPLSEIIGIMGKRAFR